MPTAAAIVLADATPSNHTFSPLKVTVESSLLVSREGTTSAGNPTLIIGLSQAHVNRATNKVSVRLNQPIEQTVDGVVSVRSTPRFEGVFTLPDDMTEAERTDFAALVESAVSDSVVQGYVTALDPMY